MRQNYPKFMTALSVVLLVILLGYPNAFNSLNEVSTYSYENKVLETERQDAQDRPINNLSDLNNALVDIASSSTQAVVTVRTEQTVTRNQRNPMDMFREFFGEPGNGGGQQREQEYRREGLGSGVIVSQDGYILTNNHVIANAETIYVGLENGDSMEAEIVGTDPESDIAVLRVDAENLPYLTFGDSENLRPGEMVLAIGSPLSEGLAHSVSQGIVSATGRGLGLMQFENFIQTDAAINRGNSGGPLINMNGEIIGINTAIASQSGGFQGVGFAIPSNIASRNMESIIEEGTVVRGFIGIEYAPVTEEIANAFDLEETGGILVNDVTEEGPATEAGLQSGDVITEINGEPIENPREFPFTVGNMRPGDEVTLTYIRDGETNTVDITLGRRPSNGESEEDEGTGTSVEEVTGFSITELTRDLAENLQVNPNLDGVVVENIDQRSDAYRNNLRQGDVIIAVNRTAVSSPSEFNEIVSNHPAGEVLLLQVVRQGTRFFVAFEPRM
ncbi:MAG: DegQ family serine endoprotease [Balneolales bacterium]